MSRLGDYGSPDHDGRLDFGATHRNRDPILDVLRPRLSAGMRVLEIGSGSGQHVAHFAAALPEVSFVPSDPEAAHCTSTNSWVAGAPNVARAIELDARSDPWPVEGPFDGVYCANVIHIAPWTVALGLFRGASSVLNPGGALWLYGPFARDGKHTAPSNEAFDARLRSQDPEWGVRDVAELEKIAYEKKLQLNELVPMPKNNFVAEFRRVP